MPGEAVLLDSVILIDHFNGVLEGSATLRETRGRASMSAITRAEVLAGFDSPGFERAVALLEHFPLIPIDAGIADLGAKLRRQHRWKLPDALQSAIAVQYGLRLLTRNTRDFDPEVHAFVEIPYQV